MPTHIIIFHGSYGSWNFLILSWILIEGHGRSLKIMVMEKITKKAFFLGIKKEEGEQ